MASSTCLKFIADEYVYAIYATFIFEIYVLIALEIPYIIAF